MNSWLTIPYHPVLRVVKKDNERIVTYSQKTPGELGSYSSKWKIPINFIMIEYTTKSGITSHNASNITWFEYDQVKVIDHHNPFKFYIINAEQFGKHRLISLSCIHCLFRNTFNDLHNFENFYISLKENQRCDA